MHHHMKQFASLLLDWFAHNGRDLPWRKTYHPYHIWISEVMLQQTQMDRVVLYFNRWINRFPDVHTVASASEDEILKLWEGLGYYARARNIQKCARILAEKYNGRLPEEYHALLELPGIGRYTAGAIMSLAFNRDYAVVDANIERLFARIFNITSPIKDKLNSNTVWQKAQELIPAGKARLFNQAMMELGALLCLPRFPECEKCPLTPCCQAFHLGVTGERPIPGTSKQIIPIDMASGILIHRGKIFIQKRLDRDVWANLWEFPGGRLKNGETPEAALVREFREETELAVENLEKIKVIKHRYTIYRVTLHCFFCTLINDAAEPVLHAAQEFKWVNPESLAQFAFSAGHRKLNQILIELPRFQKLLSVR